jgi:succinyl-diaminopimelate desuccinylase
MTVDSPLFEKISKRIDSYREQMIALQVRLTAIPALGPENGGDGELKKAVFLESFLRDAGFGDIGRCDASDSRVSSGIRPNLITRLPGKNPGRTVWILTHTDIVPPGERDLWEGDPYGAFVKDGRIYGRGTEDNQQDLVASLFAAKAFLDEGISPESDVALAFVADEETASVYGLPHVLQSMRSAFRTGDWILVPDFGNREGSLIEVAEKSLLWLKIRTRGKQCHASTPGEGINAFVAASHLVVRLRDLYRRYPLSDPVFVPPESTFEATRKEANIPNVNTVPGDDVFYLDCRILPAYTVEGVKETIREIAAGVEKEFGVSVEISPVQEHQAPEATAPDAPAVRALRSALKAVYGIEGKPTGIGGGTVAAFFRREGLPAVVWSKTNSTFHQANENCIIDNMMGNAKVYAHLFLQRT